MKPMKTLSIKGSNTNTYEIVDEKARNDIEKIFKKTNTTNEVLDKKADKENAVLTGSLSMGRNPVNQIGEDSTALGKDVAAIGYASQAEGHGIVVYPVAGHSEGSGNLCGSKGFTIIAIDTANKTYTLDSVEGLEINDVYSVNICYTDGGNSQGENCGKITAINGNVVTVDKLFCERTFATKDSYINVIDGVDYDTEQNVFRIIAKPTIGTRILGYAAHTEGRITQALSKGAHAEGQLNISYGSYSHTEGNNNQAGFSSHAEGGENIASGFWSHVEGKGSKSLGHFSHAEGVNTTASNQCAHSEGRDTTASGELSHAEGFQSQATANISHAEGNTTTASGENSHAEGCGSISEGYTSHAEGRNTHARGDSSHVEGYQSYAIGSISHAEGQSTSANAQGSHTEGFCTIASHMYQHVQGKYNKLGSDGKSGNYAHIIGNGNDYSNRSNAHTLDWQGNAWYQGSVSSNGADYAEFFEWLDGNPESEDRVGLLVTLDGEKIKPANNGDEILGIISGTAAVLGDNYECDWNGKYLTDDFGRIVYDNVEEFCDVPVITIDYVENEETGEMERVETVTTETHSMGVFKHPRINPAYNPEQEYVNRANRPEWDTVGMIGKLYLCDDGTCQINQYARAGSEGIATMAEGKTNIRVLARMSENIIKVILK